MEVIERRVSRPKPVESKAEKPISELFHEMINDKIHKYTSSPKGAMAYTGLNLIVSLLPAASFLIDDTMLEHVVKHFVDDRFSLRDDSPKRRETIEKLLQNNDALLKLRQMAVQRAKEHGGLTEYIANSTHHPDEYLSHDHAHQMIHNARENWQRISTEHHEHIKTVQHIGHLQGLQFDPSKVHYGTNLAKTMAGHAQAKGIVLDFVAAKNAKNWYDRQMHPDKTIPLKRAA